MVDSDKKVPVTILTGFLGSGKTTLLQHILTAAHGKKIAVIENEYGSPIGVHNEVHEDGLKKASSIDEILETANGCLCCSGRDEFAAMLHGLIDKRDRFDYLIIETTGLVDPSFAQIFFLSEACKKHLYLDGTITMVDAKNAMQHLIKTPNREAVRPDIEIINEAVEQIAFGDRIIINKTDLVSEEDLQVLEKKIKEINPNAAVRKTSYSKVPLDEVLDIRSFEIDRVLQRDPGYLDYRPYRQHDDEIGSVTLVGEGDINDLETFRAWMQQLNENCDLFRCKGVLSLKGSKERYVLQGVCNSFEITKHMPWGDERPLNKLVFIGKNLQRQTGKMISSFMATQGIQLRVQFSPTGKKPPPPFLPRLIVMVIFFVLSFYPNEVQELATSVPLWTLVPAVAALFYYLWTGWSA